jgi:hypothetical protein
MDVRWVDVGRWKMRAAEGGEPCSVASRRRRRAVICSEPPKAASSVLSRAAEGGEQLSAPSRRRRRAVVCREPPKAASRQVHRPLRTNYEVYHIELPAECRGQRSLPIVQVAISWRDRLANTKFSKFFGIRTPAPPSVWREPLKAASRQVQRPLAAEL